jgi:hypothetical protein
MLWMALLIVQHCQTPALWNVGLASTLKANNSPARGLDIDGQWR